MIYVHRIIFFEQPTNMKYLGVFFIYLCKQKYA